MREAVGTHGSAAGAIRLIVVEPRAAAQVGRCCVVAVVGVAARAAAARHIADGELTGFMLMPLAWSPGRLAAWLAIVP